MVVVIVGIRLLYEEAGRAPVTTRDKQKLLLNTTTS